MSKRNAKREHVVMDRRRFLQATGLAAGSLFLPSTTARADTVSRPPQRLVLFYTQHGTVYDRWRMLAGHDASTRFEYDLSVASEGDFSDALRPLHPWRRKLAVVDGLALVSAELDTSGLRHIAGKATSLTGAGSEPVAGFELATAPSIDQRIADAIARADRLRTLEIGIGRPDVSVNYSGDRNVLPWELDPRATFQRLFGLAGEVDSVGVSASVLDLVSERYDSLARRSGAADRDRLNTHRDLVRDLETRVRGLSQVTCEAPEPPTFTADYGTDFTTHVGLLSAALSCDLVRVATFHMGELPGARVDASFRGDVHEYAHDIYQSQDAEELMVNYTRQHAREFAELLEALDSVPEGDGTLLDSTTVVWCGELADGNHGFERWPIVVAGGRGFRLGRYFHWPSTTPFAGLAFDGRLDAMALPHQKFLTTLGRSFGLDIDAMPIRELSGIGGARIDCTGLLPGVLVG